jgi:hypothetical protein
MAALSFAGICVAAATSCLSRHVPPTVALRYLPPNQRDFFGARLAISPVPLVGRG